MLDFQSVERPYPGLRPFEPWEAAIFFGREEHTDRLQEILKREHFLSVTGPSGCGKSSLVRAGLLPALPLGAVGTGSSWRFAIMRPGDRPILSLAHVLLEPQAFGQELRHLPPGKSDFTEQAIEAELRRGSLGFISLITDAKQHTDDKDCNLLLLVDQFEEIFTYAEAGARQADEADAFIDLLLHARKARESRIFVVLTMRTDFLGNCVRFLDLPEAINHSLYLTPRLTRDQLAQAMNGPARTFGGELDPVLVDELVNAVANDPDQLPVLQHALARMWDRAIATGQHAPTLRLADLDKVGGVSKALSQHADEVLVTLTPEQQLNAEWLFRAITDQRSAEAGGQMVRRPQSLQRIGVWSSRPWEAFIPVLKAFAAPHVNFLTYPGQPDEPPQGASAVIDISHEALMRQWGTLKTWIACEAEAGQAYRDLLARAKGEAEKTRALLYGTDLENALKWSQEGLQFGVTHTSATSVAKPTAAWATRFTESVREIADSEFALVADYIGRSHEAEMTVIRRDRRRRRVLTILTLLVFAAGLGLAVFGWKMYEYGIVMNAQGLWHSLDFSSSSWPFDGLITLARSPRSERQSFLNLSIARADLSDRLAYGFPHVLNAAVGIDYELHDRLAEEIRSTLRSGDRAMPFVARVLTQQWLGEELDINKLFEAIEKTTASAQLYTLGQGLSALVDKLDAAQASVVLPQFLEALGKTTAFGLHYALRQELSALVDKLDAAQASAVLPQFLEALGKTMASEQLYALSQGLSALAGRLDADQKAHKLAVIGASMLEARSGVQAYFLAQSASAFLEGVPLSGQRARYWIEACRHPFVDRSEVARAIRLGNPGAPSEEQGLWALLRWAVAEYKIDSRASLKPPVAENR
jgi:hypothetical protein